VIRITDLTTSCATAWVELFESCGCPCFCRYWHFMGTKHEWLDRCAHEPERNRAEQLHQVACGDASAQGLVALDVAAGMPGGERTVGWMKLAARGSVAKLRRLPVYRRVDLDDDEGIWSIACFLVHPEWRRRGVARALVVGAQQRLVALGGRALEAYPRRTSEPIHDEEAWMGPLALFESQGFVFRHADGPYPVLRWRVPAVGP
jgi:ribosomal protein S18 acetylase RimI-like enzyme